MPAKWVSLPHKQCAVHKAVPDESCEYIGTVYCEPCECDRTFRPSDPARRKYICVPELVGQEKQSRENSAPHQFDAGGARHLSCTKCRPTPAQLAQNL